MILVTLTCDVAGCQESISGEWGGDWDENYAYIRFWEGDRFSVTLDGGMGGDAPPGWQCKNDKLRCPNHD